MNFNLLRYGIIIGIIDNYDAVHSVFYALDDDQKTHEELWPTRRGKRWRWTFSNCFNCSILSEENLNREDWERVRNHLTRQYGIKWWDNGYHDIDHFKRRLETDRILDKHERFQFTTKVRRGFVCINSWAGREEKPCLIIGETRKRYRIKVEQPTALPPKWKILHPGETKLVPKWAVKIRRAVVSASCARIGCSKS